MANEKAVHVDTVARMGGMAGEGVCCRYTIRCVCGVNPESRFSSRASKIASCVGGLKRPSHDQFFHQFIDVN
ncbi:hypothetical protein E2C01_102544 [Portunus trituberculatus]|uniref:Uncharacterized protein n=1 Tax=Portunus trituberculatus TaxID=210409 RepID=A0A5B7KN23_PORTR|nr:hypothetical protein [Portunus trituberculatus]